MGRAKRAVDGGMVFHVLNRANARATKQSRRVVGTFPNHPEQRAVEPELMEALNTLLRDAAMDPDRVSQPA